MIDNLNPNFAFKTGVRIHFYPKFLRFLNNFLFKLQVKTVCEECQDHKCLRHLTFKCDDCSTRPAEELDALDQGLLHPLAEEVDALDEGLLHPLAEELNALDEGLLHPLAEELDVLDKGLPSMIIGTEPAVLFVNLNIFALFILVLKIST